MTFTRVLVFVNYSLLLFFFCLWYGHNDRSFLWVEENLSRVIIITVSAKIFKISRSASENFSIKFEKFLSGKVEILWIRDLIDSTLL